ncbi:MobF family relaxase [Pseudoxanthomonas mexicana]
MLNTTTIIGNAGIDYLRASEYYKDREGHDVSPMVWRGRGLQHVGLAQGAAREADFVSLAKGFDQKGKPLVQNAGSEKRRIGIDWTFSADKSVSEAMAMADPELRDRIIAAHHMAVDKAIGFLEQFAETHRDKAGQNVEKVAGLVAARVTHVASRELDPQLHCHVLVMNVAPRTDGTFGAVDQSWMLNYKKAASALYRAELAHGMQELGFGITKVVEKDAHNRETGDIFFSLTGMNEEWRNAVSTRRQQIVQHVAEHGGSMDRAALVTRRKKDEPSFEECVAIWKETHAQLQKNGIALTVDQLQAQPSLVQGIGDHELLAKCTENEAVFTRAQLIARLAQENVGIMGMEACLAEADRVTQSLSQQHELIDVQPDAPANGHRRSGRHDELRMTSREIVTMELEAVESARQRRDDRSVQVPNELVEASIEAFERDSGLTMNDEQKTAARHATQSGGTCIIEGRAGTGKTTVSKAFVAAFQSDGRNVIGVSEGWDAAKKLEAESGIPSYSSASLLQELRSGKRSLTSKDVLVVDEAGMVGTRNIRAFQQFCDAAGAKLVLQGDSRQLQPVSAGGLFRLIRKEVGAATLSVIRRQKGAQDLATAKMMYRDTGLAFKAMEANGQMHAANTPREAMQALTTAFLSSPTPDREKLILVGTHAEGKQVTSMVRDGLKSKGVLFGLPQTFKALTGRWHDTIEVQAGDRLRFTKKDVALGVVNGTSGVVVKLDAQCITLRLESDIKSQDGRIVTIDTKRNDCFAHDWTKTVHKSQGQSKDEVYMLASPKMTDAHLGLVGFTRMKRTFGLYGAEEDITEFGRRIGVERQKVNASEHLLEAGFARIKERLAGLLHHRRSHQQLGRDDRELGR